MFVVENLKYIVQVFASRRDVTCLPESDFEPSPSEAPLLLAQVCHQWRSIALTTPRLWSCFRLSRPLYSTGYSNTVFLLLETWLSRSGSSPLTIFQETGREFEREEDCPSLGPVLDLLRHAYHWRDMRLALSYKDILWAVGGSAPEFPVLSKLGLNQLVSPLYTPSSPSLSGLAGCSKLQNLTLDSPDLVDPFPHCLPWARLTRFEGHYLLEEEALQVLGAALNLQEFILRLRYSGGFRPEPGELLTHPRLKSLEIYEMRLDVLAALTLPGLLKFRAEISAEELPKFLSFQSRSGCILIQLDVQIFSLADADFVQLLSAVPYLQEPRVRSNYSPINYILLNRQNGHLPMLTTLHISNSTYQDAPYNTLIDMLQSRQMDDEGAKGLESFTLECLYTHRPPNMDQLAGLATLRESGMNIFIRIGAQIHPPPQTF